MNIIEALMGKKYPQFESAIYADGSKVVVTVSRTLSPDHVELDSPHYVENKFKKQIPILTSIGVVKTRRQMISEIAEDKLSEPAAIKSIGLDCKPFIYTNDESKEETQADA